MIEFTVDTNILFYAFDVSDPRKHAIAQRCVNALKQRRGSIPLQCLSEFYRSVTRKRILSPSDARFIVETFAAQLHPVPANESDLKEAMTLSLTASLQFFDAMLVCTASRSGCVVLLTEDMQPGRTFGSIRLVNPFLLSPSELDELLKAH